MPLIADGVYKIWNVRFHAFVADLINEHPIRPISGFTEDKVHLYDLVCALHCIGLSLLTNLVVEN